MISVLIPLLVPLGPLAAVLVVVVVTVVMMVITVVMMVAQVVGVSPALRLYAGSVQGVVPAPHHGARGRGQRPRPRGPGGQRVSRPVTPGHLNTSQREET